MVVIRKNAVRPPGRCEPSMPNITTMPATMAIRLMITWTSVKVARLIPRTMEHPVFKSDQRYDALREKSTCDCPQELGSSRRNFLHNNDQTRRRPELSVITRVRPVMRGHPIP